MKLKKVKKPAIIFDFDGTLTKGTEQGKTLFIKAVREYGAKVIKKNMDRYWGINVLDLILKSCATENNRPLDSETASLILNRWTELDATRKIPLGPGIRKMLRKLFLKGYFLTILSGRSFENLISQLEKLDIKKYFSVIQANEKLAVKDSFYKKRIFYHKPNPNALGVHLTYLRGLSYEKAFFVDDGIDNCKMVKKLHYGRNIIAIGIANSHQKEHKFMRAGLPQKNILHQTGNFIEIIKDFERGNY